MLRETETEKHPASHQAGSLWATVSRIWWNGLSRKWKREKEKRSPGWQEKLVIWKLGHDQKLSLGQKMRGRGRQAWKMDFLDKYSGVKMVTSGLRGGVTCGKVRCFHTREKAVQAYVIVTVVLTAFEGWLWLSFYMWVSTQTSATFQMGLKRLTQHLLYATAQSNWKKDFGNHGYYRGLKLRSKVMTSNPRKQNRFELQLAFEHCMDYLLIFGECISLWSNISRQGGSCSPET